MKPGVSALAAAGFSMLLSFPASAAPIVPLPPDLRALSASTVTQVNWPCPPGYHIGRGGQRCWPNGWAPVEELPRGFVPAGPRVEPMPPVLECPPGYHLGRGLQRCWPN